MAKPHLDAAPPLAFPFWPFSCLDFYRHVIRDCGRYGEAMTHASDPLQTLRAEGDYGLQLWQDVMQAYFDLAVLPMTLAAKAAAAASTDQPGQAERAAAE